ncbi:MAG: hypothetical protein BWY26_00520 [Elusimicrobia bacterium ADurb.Bin231]|nr:MAG: hypothetical protein BWY26_00520 [Elusimicrobia bacterium ADurb.Bin231]
MAKHLFSQRFFFRCVKFVLALLLLPVLIGLVNAFWRFLSAHGKVSLSEIWFISGFFIFPVIYYLQVLPGHIYVFGHEITHAMWVYLFKGKIKKISVSSSSGSVLTTKNNFLISLAPYFFPFYTFLIILIFYLLALIFDVAIWINWLFFFVGFTYSFHILLTLDVLMSEQSDIEDTGRFFSWVIILILNISVTSVIIKFVEPDVINLREFFSYALRFSGKTYNTIMQYLLQKL